MDNDYKLNLEYIPIHSAEYLSKLQEYNFLERGAFVSIIHLCVITNYSLPEKNKIYRRLGAFSEDEKNAINNVIEDAKAYILPVIEQQQSLREKRANAGRAGGRSKAKTNLKQNVSKTKATLEQKGGKFCTNTNTNTKTNTKDRNIYKDDFLNFYAIYPNRNGDNPKEPAFRWWNKRLKEGFLPEQLTKAAKDYQLFCNAKNQTGTEFVFKASNFLGRDKHFLTNWEEQAHAKANTTKPKTAAERYQQTTDIIKQSIQNDCDKMLAVQNDGDMGK